MIINARIRYAALCRRISRTVSEPQHSVFAARSERYRTMTDEEYHELEEKWAKNEYDRKFP